MAATGEPGTLCAVALKISLAASSQLAPRCATHRRSFPFRRQARPSTAGPVSRARATPSRAGLPARPSTAGPAVDRREPSSPARHGEAGAALRVAGRPASAHVRSHAGDERARALGLGYARPGSAKPLYRPSSEFRPENGWAQPKTLDCLAAWPGSLDQTIEKPNLDSELGAHKEFAARSAVRRWQVDRVLDKSRGFRRDHSRRQLEASRRLSHTKKCREAEYAKMVVHGPHGKHGGVTVGRPAAGLPHRAGWRAAGGAPRVTGPTARSGLGGPGDAVAIALELRRQHRQAWATVKGTGKGGDPATATATAATAAVTAATAATTVATARARGAEERAARVAVDRAAGFKGRVVEEGRHSPDSEGTVRIVEERRALWPAATTTAATTTAGWPGPAAAAQWVAGNVQRALSYEGGGGAVTGLAKDGNVLTWTAGTGPVAPGAPPPVAFAAVAVVAVGRAQVGAHAVARAGARAAGDKALDAPGHRILVHGRSISAEAAAVAEGYQDWMDGLTVQVSDDPRHFVLAVADWHPLPIVHRSSRGTGQPTA